MVERTLAGVEHLVSLVEGRLRPRATLTDVLAATFPGGSVTGAPWPAAESTSGSAGGIVWDSDPEEEIEESWVKARPLLAAVGTSLREPTPD